MRGHRIDLELRQGSTKQIKPQTVSPVYPCNCNCNYILFTKLPWPGDSEGTFRSSSQATICPPVYHTRRRLHTVPLIAEHQAGKLWIPIFIVFGLTRPGIEPESTTSVADALSTRPLIGFRINHSTTDRFFPGKDGSTVRYSTFRICVLRTSCLEPYVPAYRTSIQAYQHTVPISFQKKEYCTSLPYFLAKIKAYLTVLPFLLSTTRSFNWLWNHQSINQRSQLTHLISASAVFCLCIRKSGAMCEMSGIFNSNFVPTYRTCTITKQSYCTSVPYFLAKIEAYRTNVPYRNAILDPWFHGFTPGPNPKQHWP